MRARLGTALVAVCLAVAGCSDDADGQETGPTLPPVTEAPSPSPSPEAVPTEATEATPEGAAEFVRFFYETIERSYQSQDPEPIRALSAEGCKACEGFIGTVEGLVADGASVRDDYEVDVLSVEAPGLEPGQATVTALVIIDVTEFVRLGPDGAVTTTEPPLRNHAQNITLRRAGDSWVVVEVTQS